MPSTRGSPAPAAAVVVEPTPEPDPIRRALAIWFRSLSPWVATQAVRGIHMLNSRGEITYGSLFSGSDITARVFDKLADLFSTVSGRDCHIFTPMFQCESDAAKRIWLLEQFADTGSRPGCKYLFGDAVELAEQSKAYDHRSQSHKMVPKVDIVSAGFSCKSKSKLNKGRGSFRNCVQHEDGETGTTFAHTKKFVEKKRPRVVLGERGRVAGRRR